MSSKITKLLKGYTFPAEFRGRLGSSSSGAGGMGEEMGSTPAVKLKLELALLILCPYTIS